MKHTLIQKYNKAVPRYTSYPTVPFWKQNTPSQIEWFDMLRSKMQTCNEIGLYIHLPFCESLCTYCGCNTRITVNHQVELPYIESVIKEWRLYVNNFEKRPLLKDLHLGGGTPTFFSASNLKYLIQEIIRDCDIHEDAEFSFEGHPGNTTQDHLLTLYNLGFCRVSFGIQDFDFEVQDAINRYQSVEQVAKITALARKIGYKSINYDMVYGLPKQNKQGLVQSVNEVINLNPDRIAFYSYAHVPWLKPGQRKFTEIDLPQGEEKKELYLIGKQLFTEAGYKDIGMDHFCLTTDSLYKAKCEGRLHRNFMGYTDKKGEILIGLGVSAISDIQIAYRQNIKVVENYQSAMILGELPSIKGFVLDKVDLEIKEVILNLCCQGKANLGTITDREIVYSIKNSLIEFQLDNLIEMDDNEIQVTELGNQYIRNICSIADQYLQLSTEQLFSNSM